MANKIVETIKTDIRHMTAAFANNGLTTNDPIWVIKEACDDCPHGDPCRESCDGKDKKYLE